MSSPTTVKSGEFGRHTRLTLAIAGREIRATLSSPLAYVFVGLFVAVAMVCFFLIENFFTNDQASARGFFRWMPALLVLVCPALTMRLWADERKLGTYEILATLPMHAIDLVLGKFLAAWALLAAALVFTFGIPIVASLYGNLDWGPVIGGYIGAFLLGSTYIAIGLVCSALVTDQILALFLGWALCALTLLPDATFWESILPSGAASALKAFGFQARFESVQRGLLALGDFLFYLSFTAWFLFVNTALIRWRRYVS